MNPSYAIVIPFILTTRVAFCRPPIIANERLNVGHDCLQCSRIVNGLGWFGSGWIEIFKGFLSGLGWVVSRKNVQKILKLVVYYVCNLHQTVPFANLQFGASLYCYIICCILYY